MSLMVDSTITSFHPADDLIDIDESLFDFDFSSLATPDVHNLHPTEATNFVIKLTKSNVTKLKKKPTKRTSRMLQGMVNGSKVPNMSRRAEGSVMVAFPTFDKCDSLVFLPSSFTRFMNNGDVPGMTNLIRTHTTKNCDCYFKGHNVRLAGFFGLNELSTELHPDAVSCVSATKVVNNTIQAKVLTKFTECDTIFNSVAMMKKNDPTFRFLFGDYKVSKREDRWNNKVRMMDKDDEVKEQLMSIVNIPGNLLVYGSFYLTFTFDAALRKVTRIDYDFDVTSLSHAPSTAHSV